MSHSVQLSWYRRYYDVDDDVHQPTYISIYYINKLKIGRLKQKYKKCNLPGEIIAMFEQYSMVDREKIKKFYVN